MALPRGLLVQMRKVKTEPERLAPGAVLALPRHLELDGGLAPSSSDEGVSRIYRRFFLADFFLALFFAFFFDPLGIVTSFQRGPRSIDVTLVRDDRGKDCGSLK